MFELGARVKSEDYEFVNAIVTGIEMIANKYIDENRFASVEDCFEELQSYQYQVLYEFEGNISHEWFFEHFLEEE